MMTRITMWALFVIVLAIMTIGLFFFVRGVFEFFLEHGLQVLWYGTNAGK